MKTNFKVVQETDDHVVLFDNLTETELTFNQSYLFLRGATVRGDMVVDYIPTYKQVLECQDALFDYWYNKSIGDTDENYEI